jgi:putative MATE family efflux protein
MQRPRSLTEGSISRGLIEFSLPILYANVLQTLNGSVNSVWVGKFLGEAALTATSNANMVMFLLISAAFGIAMAATIMIGRAIGANDMTEAKRVVGTSTTFFATISVCMAVVGYVFCEPMLVAMRTPADSLPLAVAYMRVIFLALPFLYMYAFVGSVLRGAGDSKTPFYFMLLSVAIDIALNPLFIFGWGPVPRLGIAGSGLATMVSQGVTLVALVRHLYRRRHPIVIHRSEIGMLRLDWSVVGTLVRKGIPMGGQMLVLSLSGVLMISIVNRLGVDTAAAYGASLQLWNYVQMPAFAVGLGVSAMAAQNVGAGKWDRVHATARIGVIYGLLLTGSIVLLLEILDENAYALFLPIGSAAMHDATVINRIATPSFVFFGISLVLFGVVRSTGAVMAPFATLTVTLLVIRIPLAEYLSSHVGARAVWWAFPAGSGLSASVAVLYYKYGGWRSARMGSYASVPSQPAEGA